MYRKKGRGWTKHIDFMLLDVLGMQIAFIVSYMWRFGMGNPYVDKDYRTLAVAFLLIDFFVEIVFDAFKNVLKRGHVSPSDFINAAPAKVSSYAAIILAREVSFTRVIISFDIGGTTRLII